MRDSSQVRTCRSKVGHRKCWQVKDVVQTNEADWQKMDETKADEAVGRIGSCVNKADQHCSSVSINALIFDLISTTQKKLLLRLSSL